MRGLPSVLFIAILVASALGSIPASSEASGLETKANKRGYAAPSSVLERFDRNHNGVLDPDEREVFRQDILERLRPLKERIHEQYDRNGDGVLDAAEKQVMQQERESRSWNTRGKALAKWDANADGVLDADEKRTMRAEQKAWLNSKREEALEIYDANSNGVLDPEEMSVIRELARKKREELREKIGRGDDLEINKTDDDTTRPESQFIPAQYALRKNFPDPFNPTTIIEFDLPEPAVVSLTVYTVDGRVVAMPAQQQRFAAGRHQVRFNGSALPTGVYVYKLEAGSFTDSRKMVMIK